MTTTGSVGWLDDLHHPQVGGRERNPVVRWLVKQCAKLVSERKAAHLVLLLSKVGAVALVWFVAFVPIAHTASEDIRMGALLGLATLYALIAAHNYNAYCKMKERR